MSFLNASQQIQLYVSKYGNVDRNYEVIDGIISASRANSKIRFVDSGLITNGAGKLRQLKVTYFPILCSVPEGCNTTLCSPGTKISPKQINFNLKQCTSTPVYELDRTDIRFIDGNHVFSEVAMSIIYSALPTARRNLAIDMLTLLTANMGCQLDGNTTHQVTPSMSTTGQVNPVGLWDIERTFADGGFERPWIIGGLDVFNWKKGVAIGGVNLQGQDIAKLQDTNMYYDDALLNQVLGDAANGGHIVAFDPQAIKFVSFSENAGIFATSLQSPMDVDRLFYEGNQSFILGVFRDPITGILWDFNAKFDICAGTDGLGAWTFQLKFKWDIFFLPEVACNAAQCVNGIFHFRTCVPVILNCPTGQALPSPVAARTYAATPSITYPLYVANAKIGSVASSPNVNITNIADLVAMLNDNGQGYVFTVNGSAVNYTGYSPITVTLNGGNVTFTFS